MVWSSESCVTAARCFCARVVHWKVKVTSRCVAATVWAARHYMHHSLLPLAEWKPYQCTSAWRHHWNRNAGTCLSETGEVCLWAEMASGWNMVNNQQSFIDQSIDQWRDCLIACLKAKSKHFEHLLWCVSLRYVTVMTFKAYTTAVMNKLTYVSFHKVGWEQPSGEVVNFCCSFIANLLKYLYVKNYENIMRFVKVIAKIIRVHFLPCSVVLWVSNSFAKFRRGHPLRGC